MIRVGVDGGHVNWLLSGPRIAQRRHRGGFGSLRRLPSKRYQASYLDPSGERVLAPTTFQTKADAESWLATISASITEGRWKPLTTRKTVQVTFEEYLAQWVQRRELKPRTRREYEKLLKVLLEPFGSKRLDTITPAMVRGWHESLDPTMPSRRAHLYALLRTIMGTAAVEELIIANPCHLRGAGKAKRARKIRRASMVELKTMTEAMPDQWRMLVQLAVWCALRFGELTELRRKDVDLAEGVLRISRGVTWVNGQAIVGVPKSEAGIRDGSIPPHLTEHPRAQPTSE